MTNFIDPLAVRIFNIGAELLGVVHETLNTTMGSLFRRVIWKKIFFSGPEHKQKSQFEYVNIYIVQPIELMIFFRSNKFLSQQNQKKMADFFNFILWYKPFLLFLRTLLSLDSLRKTWIRAIVSLEGCTHPVLIVSSENQFNVKIADSGLGYSYVLSPYYKLFEKFYTLAYVITHLKMCYYTFILGPQSSQDVLKRYVFVENIFYFLMSIKQLYPLYKTARWIFADYTKSTDSQLRIWKTAASEKFCYCTKFALGILSVTYALLGVASCYKDAKEISPYLANFSFTVKALIVVLDMLSTATSDYLSIQVEEYEKA